MKNIMSIFTGEEEKTEQNVYLKFSFFLSSCDQDFDIDVLLCI
jgi:hypothetical protein